MCGRRSAAVRRGRARSPAFTSPCRRSRCCQPHALGTSAGVRGYGAAGRAGGTAPAARPQAPSFHIGMGKTTKVAGYGWPSSRDGGTRDTRALGCRGGAPRPAAKHTAARRRIRPGRASPVTSPLSASRADEKQLPASTEQMRERRARVGGRGGGAGTPRGEWGCGRGRRWRRGQERRVAAEGHALVGAHGRAPAAALPARQRAAALRDGAASCRSPRACAARRVTAPPTPRLHSITGSPECARVPDYCTLANLFIGDAPAAM